MKTFSAWNFGLVFVALAACGDDNGGGTGGGNTSTNGATTTGATTGSTTTASSTATTGSTTTGSTTTGSTGSTGTGGAGMTGCEEDPNECVTMQMECACAGTCAICNDVECFDHELEVSCVNGIAGVTCICTVDGQDAGNCAMDKLDCSLEANCCFDLLAP